MFRMPSVTAGTEALVENGYCPLRVMAREQLADRCEGGEEPQACFTGEE
jgi:hypothetical protein